MTLTMMMTMMTFTLKFKCFKNAIKTKGDLSY